MAFQPYSVDVGNFKEHTGFCAVLLQSILQEGGSELLILAHRHFVVLLAELGWFALTILMEVDMMLLYPDLNKSLYRLLCSLCIQTLSHVDKEYGKKVPHARQKEASGWS